MNEMTEHNVDGVVFRTADRVSAAGGVVHGFSTRLGGVSEGVWASMNLGTGRGDDPARVEENCRRFFEAVGADSRRVAAGHQVHGTDIQTVGASGSGGCQTDGFITDRPGVALMVFTADCLPILFYDPVKRVVCAVHAGWRGTVGGIARNAVERMKSGYNCRPKDILAAIGPGISRCHFETDADVPRAVRQALGSGAEACIDERENGKFHVDLKRVNQALLLDAGLSEVNITTDDECTACRPEKYWSHRLTAGHRGSQAAVIQLTSY